MDTPMATGNRLCPACGTAIAADSGFCFKCGAALPGGGPAKPRTGMPPAGKIVLIVVAVGVFTMVLVAAAAALVAPIMLRHGDAARVTKAHADLQSFMMALASYKMDTGEFPASGQGLRALRQKPDGVKDWAGPYITPDIPKDPWGHDYVYRYPGEHGADPDVICYGADGRPGGEGINADIGSWEDR